MLMLSRESKAMCTILCCYVLRFQTTLLAELEKETTETVSESINLPWKKFVMENNVKSVFRSKHSLVALLMDF